MPVYMCRWPNGDFSFVSAASKQEAVETLDEIANAEGCALSVVRDFMVHFRLDDDGSFEHEGFGEVTENTIWKDYPILDETFTRIFAADLISDDISLKVAGWLRHSLGRNSSERGGQERIGRHRL